MNGIPRIGELEDELDEISRLVIPTINTEDEINRLLDEQRGIVKELQARVAKHNRIIAAIQARRNSFVPMINSTLLPELLAEVFLQLTIMNANDNSTPTNHYGWLRVAHVCRYWRDVMVAHPRLFSRIRIPTRDTDHLDEIIRLSAASELELHIAPIKSDHPGLGLCWETIDCLLPRTRHLRMDIDAPEIWPPCPQMVSLIWTAEGVKPFEVSRVRSVIASMPNLLSLSTATKTLGIEWLKLPLATTLTELVLDHTTQWQSNASLEELGKLLATLRSLKTLKLERLVANDYILPSSYISWPPLPHFTTLRLSGGATTILNMMRLPFRATMIDIAADASDVFAGHLVLLPRSLVEILRHDSPGSARLELCTCTIFLEWNNNTWHVNIHAWDEGRVPDRDTPTLRFLANFTSTSIKAFLDMHSALMYSFRVILANTRRLILEDFVALAIDYSSVWHGIFSCLKNIVSFKFIVFPTSMIVINEPDLHTMVQVLMTMDERGVTCLPRLQELCLAFSSHGVGPHRELMLTHLQQSLSWRRSRGRQLNTLIIDESLIPNEGDRIERDIVESLSSVVGDLIRT